MNEDKLDALLEKCESHIERKLLTQLYPHLRASHTRELEAQKWERIRRDGTRIRLDFAFPDLQIAICCDGREWHEGNPERFEKDRRESRELQLQSWTVLRFSGREINSDSEMVVDTIQRAIERREWFRNRRTRQQQERQQPRSALPVESPAPQTGQDDQKARKPVAQQKTESGGRTQQPQTPPIRQAEKSWRESTQEWRDEKLQATPKQQRKPQTQQKPEGGLCGVIFLASVIVGVLVLLDFIF